MCERRIIRARGHPRLSLPRLDAAIAELREENANGRDVAPMPQWVFHDIRRSTRTRLSELRIPDLVSELILAHRRPQRHETYDVHGYRNEKRGALEAWARCLLSIVEPAEGENVVRLRAEGPA